MPMSNAMKGWYGGLTVGFTFSMIALCVGALDNLSEKEKLTFIMGVCVALGLIGAGVGYCVENRTRLSQLTSRLLAPPRRGTLDQDLELPLDPPSPPL